MGSERQGARVGLDFIETSLEHPEEDPRGTLVATITLSHEGLCPVPAALLLVMSLALAVVSIMSRLLRAPPPVTKPLK